MSGAQVPLYAFAGEVDLGSATVEELAAEVVACVLDHVPAPEPPRPPATAQITVRRIGQARPLETAACGGIAAA